MCKYLQSSVFENHRFIEKKKKIKRPIHYCVLKSNKSSKYLTILLQTIIIVYFVRQQLRFDGPNQIGRAVS